MWTFRRKPVVPVLRLSAVIGMATLEQLKADVRMVREAAPMTIAERRALETAMG